jgi:outer membrane receptor protein involved in Fe transport
MDINLMKLKLSAIVALALASSASLGAAEKMTTSTVEVISTTPLPSIGLPLNKIPANIQIAKPKDINNQGGVSIADYINNNMQGITVSDMTGSPFQPEINFRGYSASPLLGNPQGLSTYIDGVRVNEPFGDVTLWDKIPNFAIGGMQLIPGSNPIYGLNTLGGSIAIQTKSGREAKGVGLEFEAGSWGRQRSLAEFGGVSKDGSIDYFVGFQHLKEDGWRKFSPTTLNQAFAKVGWQNESSKLNLSYIATDNNLIGNGFTPQNLLSGDRDQIHTRPDFTNNYYHHLALNGDHWLNKDVMISGNAYYRKSNRHTINGDGWENDNYTVGRYSAYTGADGCTYHATTCRSPEGYSGSVLNKTKTKQDTLGGSIQASFNQDVWGKKNQLITGLNYEFTMLQYSQRERVNISNLDGEGAVINRAPLANLLTPAADVFDATRAPIMAGNGLQPETQTVGLTGKQYNYGVFATDTLSLNDKWHLNGGARWNYSKIDNTDSLNGASAANSLTAKDTYIRINPTLGLTFNPQEKLTFFTSYSESSRAPTPIELGCSNPAYPCRLPAQMADDPPLKQVVAKTYEFGGRGDLGSSVKWNAAVYTATNHNDIQFLQSLHGGESGMSGLGYFANVGRTKRNGLDVGLTGTIDRFKWNTSYSYIDATFDSDLEMASNSNSQDRLDGGDDRAIMVKKGNSLPAIPKHQFKLRAQYQVTPDWSVGANLIAYSEQYVWGNENNAHQPKAAGTSSANCSIGTEAGGGHACGKGKLDAYGIVNLDTQYNIGKGWKAFAKATNIFDHDYDVSGRLIETLFNNAGTYVGDNKQLGLIPGSPRAAWLGLRFEFGGDEPKKD